MTMTTNREATPIIKAMVSRLTSLASVLRGILAPLPWGGAGGGLALLCGLLCSCGEYFEFGANDPVGAGQMQLARKVIPLVVGDHYAIPVLFTPDSLSNNAVYWSTEDTTIAGFENDTLVAYAEGQTLAYAYSAIDLLRDTAVVVVLPEMYVAPDSYPYDMVIYASVAIDGEPLTLNNHDPYIIGAYVGNELRGVGQMRRLEGTDYMVLRVWSPFSYGDEVRLRCYFRGQARALLFPDVFIFDGERHGTLSSLYPLRLDTATAEEYLPAVGGGIIDVPEPIIVEDGEE